MCPTLSRLQSQRQASSGERSGQPRLWSTRSNLQHEIELYPRQNGSHSQQMNVRMCPTRRSRFATQITPVNYNLLAVRDPCSKAILL